MVRARTTRRTGPQQKAKVNIVWVISPLFFLGKSRTHLQMKVQNIQSHFLSFFYNLEMWDAVKVYLGIIVELSFVFLNILKIFLTHT